MNLGDLADYPGNGKSFLVGFTVIPYGMNEKKENKTDSYSDIKISIIISFCCKFDYIFDANKGMMAFSPLEIKNRQIKYTNNLFYTDPNGNF